jgi:hypothetical protein
MAVAFPAESAAYRAARNRLLDQEIELRRTMAAVADARRRLPLGGASRSGIESVRAAPLPQQGLLHDVRSPAPIAAA